MLGAQSKAGVLVCVKIMILPQSNTGQQPILGAQSKALVLVCVDS